MKPPRLRFSILMLMVLIALIAVGLTTWEHYVTWPAAQARFAEILETTLPKPEILRTAENLVRRYPELARQEGTMTWAVIHGDVTTCRVFLDAGATLPDESELLPNSVPLLYLPVSQGEHEKVKLLIERGAEVDVAFDMFFFGASRLTLLQTAASFGHTEMCQLLIDKGANVNHQSSEGNTPLHLAVQGLHPPTVQLLLANHASSLKNNLDWTPLEVAQNLFPLDLPPAEAQAQDEIIRLLEQRQPIDRVDSPSEDKP